MKKFLAMLLALTMVASMAACGNKETAPETPDAPAVETPDTTPDAAEETEEPVEVTGEYVDPYADVADDYDALSEAVYNDVLGEFNEVYQTALAEETNISRRFALMAQAEAKLLESAVMLPVSTQGGNYGISAIAKRSASTTLWGTDYMRQYTKLVTTELIKAEDQKALIALWNETRGTGTWMESAKAYLTEHGYELKDSLSMGYVSDPKVWDILATSQAGDSDVLVQTYDGLMEYNAENVQVPALAESYEISDDGLTYTFHIREGVKWVDSQGREVADLTADDFVAGMQHMMDAMGGLEYLVQPIIVNADAYITGEITDFSQVGVKAVDDYTLQYTLVKPTSYFMTMLSYGVFAPMNRGYYESMGGKFGADYDASAADYKYGKGPDSIAYCGPFTVTNATPGNTIVFKANPTYWNAENQNIKSLTMMYNDGKDPLKAYKDTMSKVLDGCGLAASTLEAVKADGMFDDYVIPSDTNATTFSNYYNVNRQAYANFNDGAAASQKTEEAKIRDTAAMRNEHFRRAVSFATDRAVYNAQTVGEDLKLNSLRNTYTPGNFVTLAEEVTIDINGTETTFPAGTYYGEIVQAQIDADGVQMTVWDAENETSDGFDGWYNPEAAKAEMKLAVKELAAIGIEVSAENPIYIDVPYFAGSEIYSNRANAYKKSLETVLENKVVVNLITCNSQEEWLYAGYFSESGMDSNFDMYDVSGWGPDYGDPQTYLDTFLPDYAGFVTRCIGLF